MLMPVPPAFKSAPKHAAALAMVCALLSAQVAHAARKPVVWLQQLDTVGLTDAETQQFRAQLDRQMNAIGYRLVSPAMPSGCLEDLNCRVLTLHQLSAQASLWVSLLRGGPVMQLSVLLTDAEGAELRTDQQVLQAEQLAQTPLLSPQMVRLLQAMKPTQQKDTKGTGEAKPGPKHAGTAAAATQPNIRQNKAPLLAPRTVGLIGLAGSTIGAGLFISGAAWGMAQKRLLDDPTTRADQRNRALVAGYGAAAIAGFGVISLAASGVIAALGLGVE